MNVIDKTNAGKGVRF